MSLVPLLDIRDVRVHFPLKEGRLLKRRTGVVRAVDGVSLNIGAGETVGLVGESGCGKSTLARSIVRLVHPTCGTIQFAGRDLATVPRAELRTLRPSIQMVFQDPYASLNPRMTVADAIAEPMIAHGLAKRSEAPSRVAAIMSRVGLAAQWMRKYPHEFSGGQRQRIAIARALALRPKLIIADEPVSALDVSVRAQILNLLLELQGKLNLSYLFVSHDLSVIRHISHRVGVMYVGKMVELAATEELFQSPKHPYTEALLSAIPLPDPRMQREEILLTGEIANPANPPQGCYFHPRCRFVQDVCRREPPAWQEIAPEHWAACHFAQTLNLQGV